jgi:hypothetical protein
VGMQPLIINRFGTLGVEEINDCRFIKHVADILDNIESQASNEKRI